MGAPWTAGPWQGCAHLRGDADKTCGCGYRGGIWSTTADVMVCEIGGPLGQEGDDMVPRSDRPTQIADHWLIAAAPDMAEALEAIVDCYGVGWKTADKFVEEVHDFMMAARAALSKAKGETP